MLSAIAAGAAGMGNVVGQHLANRANIQIAREANQFNAEQANLNRQFQERMSNTAHQREVKDLRAAGLNPILSVSKGAAVPGGATATANTTKVENAFEAGANSAINSISVKTQVAKAKKEMKLIDAQTKRTNVESTVRKRSLPEAELKNKVYDIIRPFIHNATEKVQIRGRR